MKRRRTAGSSLGSGCWLGRSCAGSGVAGDVRPSDGFPFETSQRPLYSLLGTPDKHKKHVIFDSGHVAPWPDVVRETLAWLDLYLGPVTTGPQAKP